MAGVEGQVENEELDAQREARRRFASRRSASTPTRPEDAGPAREQFDDELRNLVERMKRLMHDASGIGLAATQVGVLQRLFVFQPNEDDDVVAVVNPEIVERSSETDVDDEGCLSIQGILVPVERSLNVTLVGVDENGEDVRYELEDLYARAAQHETDHLDGVLIIDRTTPEARREALGKLRPRIVLG